MNFGHIVGFFGNIHVSNWLLMFWNRTETASSEDETCNASETSAPN